MKDAGNAHMGVGRASGKDKARLAAEAAISSPLLETSINGAKGVIVNITIPTDFPIDDVVEASDLIAEAAHPDVNLIWGVAYDENLKDEMVLTVIATGFNQNDDPSIPSYIQDIANYTPKSGPSAPASEKEASAAGTGKESAPAASASNAAVAGAGTSEESKSDPFADPDDPDLANDDPFAAIIQMFGKNKR